jgi:hypothetical protein
LRMPWLCEPMTSQHDSARASSEAVGRYQTFPISEGKKREVTFSG